jgi:hypothetical protein
MQISALRVLIGTVTGALAVAYCDAQEAALAEKASARQTVAGPANAQDLKRRQMDFLNQIRRVDPQYEVIDRAIFNERNELGIIVNRSVEMQKIRPLMRTLLTRMARQFPNQDLMILAYAPTNPPLKLGTAHLDGRTGTMAYSSEHK